LAYIVFAIDRDVIYANNGIIEVRNILNEEVPEKVSLDTALWEYKL